MSDEPRIYVVGSLNADLVQRVDRLPQAGESFAGDDLQIFAGGKGANQAGAGARLGGRVSMVGNVGNDAFGSFLVEKIEGFGVDASGVAQVDTPTGTASIYLLPNGENAIVVSPGANRTLSVEDVTQRLAGIRKGDYLLCQLENPFETIHASLRIAKRAGATTILDPAPAAQFEPELLAYADIVTPNEVEAAQIAGNGNGRIASNDDAASTAAIITEMGAKSVVLTWGAQGCHVTIRNDSFHVPAFEVEAVDSTAAGDTFNGALAVGLLNGTAFKDAVRFASAAAALSTTKPGAQDSIPSREEVLRFLEK